ncbi:hypothetical protein VCR15J2_390138 [Vibrio coralliirubri]|uniref:hypothetical protein n=1 Tax=Vibrio coralliirubri TaxID=1516159 RepID=UPI000633EE21|nr:hypothetical protein [Vibrio coralliirubri]CDT54232.1 hypothetical protein VCR15J2_390138 [Vibrio coralliirubri]
MSKAPILIPNQDGTNKEIVDGVDINAPKQKPDDYKLPGSGKITLAQIGKEFEDARPNKISDVKGILCKIEADNTGKPCPGNPYPFSRFYGVSNTIFVSITTRNNFNLEAHLKSIKKHHVRNVVVTVATNARIGSASTSSYAFAVGNMPSGGKTSVKIKLSSGARIIGRGGNGGGGGGFDGNTPKNPKNGGGGGKGGGGVHGGTNATVRFVKGSNSIVSGGGGGGGGGGAHRHTTGCSKGGCAYDYDAGQGGFGGKGIPNGSNGSPTGKTPYGGAGGAGGGFGLVGKTGGKASCSGTSPVCKVGGAGGGAGGSLKVGGDSGEEGEAVTLGENSMVIYDESSRPNGKCPESALSPNLFISQIEWSKYEDCRSR